MNTNSIDIRLCVIEIIVVVLCFIVKHIIEVKRESKNTKYNIMLYDNQNYYMFKNEDTNQYHFPCIVINKKRSKTKPVEIVKKALETISNETNINEKIIKKKTYSIEPFKNKGTHEREFFVIIYFDESFDNNFKMDCITYNEHLSNCDQNSLIILQLREKERKKHLLFSIMFMAAILFLIALVAAIYVNITKHRLNTSAIDILSFSVALVCFALNLAYALICKVKKRKRNENTIALVALLSIAIPFLVLIVWTKFCNIPEETAYLSLFTLLLGFLSYLPNIV